MENDIDDEEEYMQIPDEMNGNSELINKITYKKSFHVYNK